LREAGHIEALMFDRKDVARALWREVADGRREENAAKKQMEASFRFNRDGKSSRVMQRVESGYGQPDNP
jgi:hypothetical protein